MTSYDMFYLACEYFKRCFKKICFPERRKREKQFGTIHFLPYSARKKYIEVCTALNQSLMKVVKSYIEIINFSYLHLNCQQKLKHRGSDSKTEKMSLSIEDKQSVTGFKVT